VSARRAWFLVFCLVALAGIYVHTQAWNERSDLAGEDIFYLFVEGSRLVDGVNPYERVLSGDMRRNEKYAAHFPLFYIVSSATQVVGLGEFSEWLVFWRFVFLGFVVGIAYLIFRNCTAGGLPLLGVLGAAFWLFNRWALHVTVIAHIDFIPLFFLVLSLSLLRRRFWLACMLFGISLAFKQIGIFAFPLYMIWAWQMERPERFRHVLKAFAMIFAIPLVVSIPFVIWNAEGFVRSILFSATRSPSGHFGVPSLDVFLGWEGIPARIPMMALFGLTYALAMHRRLPPYASLLLVMAIFFSFNSVLFRQYMVWWVPFVPLTLLEIPSLRRNIARRGDEGA